MIENGWGGRLGRHVHIPAGLVAAIRDVRACGYDAVQVFPGNPKGWRHAPLAPAVAATVRDEAARVDVAPIVIHAPYIINIAATDDELAAKSAHALFNALDRAAEIAARYVVVHAGSHKGVGEEAGIARIARLVEGVLTSAPPDAEILIENSAGAGNALAGSPEALGRLLAALPPRVGSCVDTAHLWGAGCDVSSRAGVDDTLERLDRAVGLDRVRVIHLNDSAVALDSHRDVHARLGEGQIGLEGLAAWMAHPALRRHLVILETPLEHDLAREADRCAMTRLLLGGDVDAAAALLAGLQRGVDTGEAAQDLP